MSARPRGRVPSARVKSGARAARLGSPSIGSTIRYVETSALLAAALEGDLSARRAIKAHGRLVTSALTHAEAQRAVHRAQVGNRISGAEAAALIRGLAAFAERCETVAMVDEVLRRAGQAFAVEPVRTLDAIHLATIELLDAPPEFMVVVTRDARIRSNAQARGWRTE